MQAALSGRLPCGLHHFLVADATERRSRALLLAVGAIGEDSSCSDLRVEAEAPTRRGGRIDLLATWRMGDISRAVAIEAKMEAELRPGQLAEYRDEIVRRRKVSAPLLLLVTPKARQSDKAKLTINRDWTLMTWPTILLRFERALSCICPDDADYEFARFRRTLWRADA